MKRAFSQRGSGSYTGADIGERELEYEVGVKASARAWDYSREKVRDRDRSPPRSVGHRLASHQAGPCATSAAVHVGRRPRELPRHGDHRPTL